VGPAQAPDLLVAFVGQRLLGAALIQGYTLAPSVGGMRLRFEHEELVVGSLVDEWVLPSGRSRPSLAVTCCPVPVEQRSTE
jgi:hypothetical protein